MVSCSLCFQRFILLAAASAGTAGLAQAQTPAYPVKSIRMVIALAPGGGVDTTSRIIGQKLNELWGQPVVAENRPGAGETIAAETVARAAPDGYTILTGAAGLAITPSLMKLSYNAAKDLLPVTMAVISPGVMVVHPSVPAKNVKELIVFAKARPGDLFFSSSGVGSAQHLSIEMFNQLAGLKMTHVPYKGTAPSITDVVGGRIALTVASVISTRPMFTTGKLRALAVVGTKRTPALPEMPSIAESGLPGYGIDNWYGVFMPGATNKAIAVRMQEAIHRVLTTPEMRKTMLAQGLDVVASTQEEFAKVFLTEMAKWADIVQRVGIDAK